MAIYLLALCGLPLFHLSALAEIYKDKNECILKNSLVNSIFDSDVATASLIGNGWGQNDGRYAGVNS
jgi:hypothetical protein